VYSETIGGKPNKTDVLQSVSVILLASPIALIILAVNTSGDKSPNATEQLPRQESVICSIKAAGAQVTVPSTTLSTYDRLQNQQIQVLKTK
jgi:hypothetical protein